VSLTEKTNANCIDFVASCNADIIEHRLDFMHRIEELKQIYHQAKVPIIATCRPTGLGGLCMVTEDQRISHLLEAISAGASYVDIELETDSVYMELLRRKASQMDCKLIVSKHFYESTPSNSELLKLVDTLDQSIADIMKIETTPSSIEDCRRILQLYFTERSSTLPMIAFAMGDLGRFTRVCALFLGAPFMYVSQDEGEIAAPGQIPLSEMRKILEVLL
jgi:3-dehydroquinate dehydratase type I